MHTCRYDPIRNEYDIGIYVGLQFISVLPPNYEKFDDFEMVAEVVSFLNGGQVPDWWYE